MLRQFGRKHVAPFVIKEMHVFKIDALPLLGRGIGASNIEVPVLHEIVVGVAAVRFSTTSKACPTGGHQSIAFGRWGIVSLLRAFLRISGSIKGRPPYT